MNQLIKQINYLIHIQLFLILMYFNKHLQKYLNMFMMLKIHHLNHFHMEQIK